MKRPSDETLRKKMNEYAAYILDAHYGHLKALEGEDRLITGFNPDTLPKPDVFNAVVNWLRTDSGMEPITQERSGIANLTERLGKSRKRGTTGV